MKSAERWVWQQVYAIGLISGVMWWKLVCLYAKQTYKWDYHGERSINANISSKTIWSRIQKAVTGRIRLLDQSSVGNRFFFLCDTHCPLLYLLPAVTNAESTNGAHSVRLALRSLDATRMYSVVFGPNPRSGIHTKGRQGLRCKVSTPEKVSWYYRRLSAIFCNSRLFIFFIPVTSAEQCSMIPSTNLLEISLAHCRKQEG